MLKNLTKVKVLFLNKNVKSILTKIGLLNEYNIIRDQSKHILVKNCHRFCKIKNTNQNSNKTQQIGNQNSSVRIMRQIELHVESKQFKRRFNSYYYLQNYSWVCLHTWIIINKLRKSYNITQKVQGYFISKKVKSLLEQYTKNQVYQYNDSFDRSIYQQLKRIQDVIFWELDSYFYFNIKQKSIEQIIEQDLSLFDVVQTNQVQRQKKIEQMTKIGQYLLKKINNIQQKLEFSLLKQGKIQYWLKEQV